MKKLILLAVILCFSKSTIAQSVYDEIIVVRKQYTDTLKTNYRKVEIKFSKKADSLLWFDYSSAHVVDTLTVKKIHKYVYKDNSYLFSGIMSVRKYDNTDEYKIGDTLFLNTKKIDSDFGNRNITITKKEYLKGRIIYAARLFPDKQSLPYNESNYIYDKEYLIKIKEKYNSEGINEKYLFLFDYSDGIVSRVTEFKEVNGVFRKEYIWEFSLLTDKKLKKKIKKRINLFLLEDQFVNPPW